MEYWQEGETEGQYTAHEKHHAAATAAACCLGNEGWERMHRRKRYLLISLFFFLFFGRSSLDWTGAHRRGSIGCTYIMDALKRNLKI